MKLIKSIVIASAVLVFAGSFGANAAGQSAQAWQQAPAAPAQKAPAALVQQSTPNIRKITKDCEGSVTKNCVDSSCPAFCLSYNDAACRVRCTANDRCNIKPMGAARQQKNAKPAKGAPVDNSVLEALTRDRLMQCIAQKRDPDNIKSGRRTENWKEVHTPSWDPSHWEKLIAAEKKQPIKAKL